MARTRIRRFTALFLTGFLTVTPNQSIHAAVGDLFDTQRQREAQRRAAEETRRRAGEDMARLGEVGKGLRKITLPEETTAFFVTKILLDGPEADSFPWAQKYLRQYENQKIGLIGINLLSKALNEALLRKGYTTSRVYIPAQDVSGGTLVFSVLAGKVKEALIKSCHAARRPFFRHAALPSVVVATCYGSLRRLA